MLEAIPLNFSWNIPQNEKYSMVFTSKIAVQLFAQKTNFPVEQGSLKDLELIGAVGKSTADAICNELGIQKNILVPKEEGLLSLLSQTPFQYAHHVFIFTAFNGKTPETLQKISLSPLNSKYTMVQVYKLEPNQCHFLDSLLSKNFTNPMTDLVFCCRSGMVLRAVVHELMRYFSCSQAHFLPSSIYFCVDKQSTKKSLQAFNLIDRVLS